MYELKKIGNVFTSKFVVTGPSYKKIIYWATVSQRLRNATLENSLRDLMKCLKKPFIK